jgi:MoxR-like ATPase
MTEPTVPPPLSPPALSGQSLVERVDAVREAVGRAFIGQPEVLDQILIALLAGGHVLIEGVPGLGKTLLVRALAQALELDYGRVQFTPDLMPSDVSGHAVYDPKTGELQDPPWPGVHQPVAGRRDQPRAGQDPVRAARSDAGRPGHHRRQSPSHAGRRRSWRWPPRTR